MSTTLFKAERSFQPVQQEWRIGVDESKGCLIIDLLEAGQWITAKANFSPEQSMKIATLLLESQKAVKHEAV